jgi:hypothetical protein
VTNSTDKKEEGWIGVDFDGTLVEYHGANNTTVSNFKPIEPMVRRIRCWLEQGVDVRIVTARVGAISPAYETQRNHSIRIQEQTKMIQDITEVLFNRRLPVTASKDYLMIELWDDRAVQVEFNTGRRLHMPLLGEDPGREYEEDDWDDDDLPDPFI